MSEQPDAIDMDDLTFIDATPSDVPPPARPDEVTVPRTYWLPVDQDQWIIRTALAKGIPPAMLVRELLELGRTAYEQADRRVSMADVLAALASVPSGDTAS